MLPERLLIDRIRSFAPVTRAKGKTPVVRGIGDDCAVLHLKRGFQLLVTTDLFIENIHFRRNWHPAGSIGHRCLARGLSDIAAMGGEPLACFISLGLPASLPQPWVDDFFRGLTTLARRCNIQLAGGDLSSAHRITADIVVTGQIPAGKALLRSSAKPGDRIYVTGRLGHAATVLKQLYGGKKIRSAPSDAHFYPSPRLEAGRLLRQRGLATSMIDLSDGLSVDLRHICDESRVAAWIDSTKIPVAKDASLELALHGGEDYELLFTASRRTKLPERLANVRITEIGKIEKRVNYSPAIRILRENGLFKPLPQRGWEHFSRTR